MEGMPRLLPLEELFKGRHSDQEIAEPPRKGQSVAVPGRCEGGSARGAIGCRGRARSYATDDSVVRLSQGSEVKPGINA
jgi:hypothetical protein